MSLQNDEFNTVHDDENWRQRINSEEGAAANWNGNWGFLQPKKFKKTVTPDMDKNELDTIVSSIGPCYEFLEEKQKRDAERANRRRAQGQRIMGQPEKKAPSRPGSKAGQAAAPKQILGLDTQTALSLQPQTLQGVGASIITPGVDPAVKYKHPQTSMQVHGWNSTTLEFFGVSRHGRQARVHKAQFDE